MMDEERERERERNRIETEEIRNLERNGDPVREAKRNNDKSAKTIRVKEKEREEEESGR